MEVGDRAVALYSREEVPVDDWVRLTEVFGWRTETGQPAYVVLVEEHDLTVAWSCYRGQVVVITPGTKGPHVEARISPDEQGVDLLPPRGNK